MGPETPRAMHIASVKCSKDFRSHWLLACNIGVPEAHDFVTVKIPKGSFYWALLQMKAGKKVRLGRMLWELRPTGFYFRPLGEDGQPTGFWFLGLLSTDDLLATDWTLYEGEKA